MKIGIDIRHGSAILLFMSSANADSPVMKRLKKNLRLAKEKKAALMEAADSAQTETEWHRLMDEIETAQIDVEEALSAVRVNQYFWSLLRKDYL